MAIYIQINRTEDGDTLSVYEFGPVERIVGSVAVTKPAGDVELLHIDNEHERKTEFFLSRIRRVFQRHATDREFPDRTWYAA
jgi:hypothetical protein